MQIEDIIEQYPKTIKLTNGRSIVVRPLKKSDERAFHDFFSLVPETERALFKHRVSDLDVKAGAQVLGINNRDLKTFEVSLSTTETLAPLIPHGLPAVCESGIDSPEQIRRVEGWGIHLFLIGESLMRARQPGGKLRELLEQD